jgi:hypothetical protein
MLEAAQLITFSHLLILILEKNRNRNKDAIITIGEEYATNENA